MNKWSVDNRCDVKFPHSGFDCESSWIFKCVNIPGRTNRKIPFHICNFNQFCFCSRRNICRYEFLPLNCFTFLVPAYSALLSPARLWRGQQRDFLLSSNSFPRSCADSASENLHFAIENTSEMMFFSVLLKNFGISRCCSVSKLC